MLQRCSHFYIALEAAEILMKDWDDEDNDNELGMIILPPGKVDSLTDEENVNDSTEKSSKLPFTIAGLVDIDTNINTVDIFLSPQVKRSLIISDKLVYTSCLTSCRTT